MRTALVLLCLVGIGGVAFAQAVPQASPPAAGSAAPAARAPAGTLGGAQGASATTVADKKGKRPARTRKAAGSQGRPAGGTDDGLASCLGLWEPATHMTRREWNQACRRVAERLRSTTLR